MNDVAKPITVFDGRLIVERLRRRARQDRPPGNGWEGDDLTWHERTAVANACEAVADEIEQVIGKGR